MSYISVIVVSFGEVERQWTGEEVIRRSTRRNSCGFGESVLFVVGYIKAAKRELGCPEISNVHLKHFVHGTKRQFRPRYFPWRDKLNRQTFRAGVKCIIFEVRTENKIDLLDKR
jgi:hypothetical protein